jgi:hypothetical protein
LVLHCRRRVRVVARDRDLVLLREGLDDLAVVRPVGRKGDHVQAPFLPSLGDHLLDRDRASQKRRVREHTLPCGEREIGEREDRKTCSHGKTALEKLPPVYALFLEPTKKLVLLLLIVLHLTSCGE